MRLYLGRLFPPDYRKTLHALDCTRGGFSVKTKNVALVLRWLPLAGDESSSNLREFKGKHQYFSIFMTSTRAQKAKVTVNFLAFPSVNFFLNLAEL